MNMDVGSEISSKIRSAIKAKLVELNAYVDEELPDYIMVMVANKKSQLQMSEDLGLFLGANTEKFTTWLHGLLQKLQSVTSESSAVAFLTEKTVEKTKSGEQTAVEVGGKPRKYSEKQSTDESKSKKRTSDEGSEDKKQKKRRKSDQEKKSRSGDDVKSKQTSEKEDQDVCTVVEAADLVVVLAKPTLLSGPSTTSAKDNSDNIPVSQQAEKIVVQAPEKSILDLTSATSERELVVKQTVEANHSKQVTTNSVDVSDILVEDDDLSELLFTENDELTEELEQEAVVVPAKKSDSGRVTVIEVSDSEPSTKPKRGTSSIIITSDSSKSRSPLRSARPRAVTSPIRQTVRRSSPIRQTVRRSALVRAVEPRQSELQARKRRGPVSIIGSVTRDSEEEDGYDPRNPAVGNVASVVKVTARKSSIPPKLQANKSLLLKAMTEAEKSVETQRRVAVTPVKPFMRSEGRDRDRDRGRDYDRRGHSSSSRDSRRHSPPSRIAQASLRQAISQPRSSRHSPPVYIPTRKVEPAPRVESSDRVGIVSKSRRQEAHERAWLDREEETAPSRKCIKLEKSDPIVNFVIETEYDDGDEAVPSRQALPEDLPAKVKKEPVSPQKKLSYTEVTAKQGKAILDHERDSRVVEYEPEMVPSPTERSPSESGSQGVPALLEDMDQEEFLLDQDMLDLTESSLALPEEDLRQALVKDKSKDRTRFVVTLDGVDTDQYEENPMETELVEEEMDVDKLQLMKTNVLLPPNVLDFQFAAQSKDALPKMTPPKIQPLNISLKDSDEEGEAMEVEMTPLKKAKMAERCKFWPACANGQACDYHHPTIQCKTFPNCKFGEKCLYIHPNCRFDSKCVRPDCPYTHSSVRSFPSFQAPFIKPTYLAPAPPPPVMQAHNMGTPPPCKFFPKCTNMACPFLHPKPCRFGLVCKNREKGCPFFHPAVPTASKLTWVASKGSSPSLSPAVTAKEVKKVE